MTKHRRSGLPWLVAGLVTALLTVYSGPAVAADPVNTQDRAAVVASYQTQLQPLLGIPTGWDGSLQECRAGEPSAQSQDAVLSAVNYMRSLAALPEVTLNPDLSRKSQQAALIMAANDIISHDLARSLRCWTEAGYAGAKNGNLALGFGYGPGSLASTTGPRAVVNYMDDPGQGNGLVGHRRWLLYQSLAEIGNGDTDTSNSIYVLGDRRRNPARIWVPWPTSGYFPRELEPGGRWSISHPRADFRRAKVTVTTPQGKIEVRAYPVAAGFGDNTLSWDMDLPPAYASDPSADYPVTVKVTGIRMGGKKVTKEWTTTLIKAASD